MHKLSSALQEIVKNNGFLQAGVQEGIFNLSALARRLQPLIRARTKKPVSNSAVAIALSRLQDKLKATANGPAEIKVRNISVRSNLCSLTYFKTHQTISHIRALYSLAEKEGGYLTLNQSPDELTLIADNSLQKGIKALFKAKPKAAISNLAALGVNFEEKYVKAPGLLYALIQQVTLQNINIIEISSTYTELVIYVPEADLKLAFETLYEKFCQRRAAG